MEEFCQKLPEGDAVQQTLETTMKEFSELQEEIESTHQKLMQHPDKWKEYNARCHPFSFYFICNGYIANNMDMWISNQR